MTRHQGACSTPLRLQHTPQFPQQQPLLPLVVLLLRQQVLRQVQLQAQDPGGAAGGDTGDGGAAKAVEVNLVIKQQVLEGGGHGGRGDGVPGGWGTSIILCGMENA